MVLLISQKKIIHLTGLLQESDNPPQMTRGTKSAHNTWQTPSHAGPVIQMIDNHTETSSSHRLPHKPETKAETKSMHPDHSKDWVVYKPGGEDTQFSELC